MLRLECGNDAAQFAPERCSGPPAPPPGSEERTFGEQALAEFAAGQAPTQRKAGIKMAER